MDKRKLWIFLESICYLVTNATPNKTLFCSRNTNKILKVWAWLLLEISIISLKLGRQTVFKGVKKNWLKCTLIMKCYLSHPGYTIVNVRVALAVWRSLIFNVSKHLPQTIKFLDRYAPQPCSAVIIIIVVVIDIFIYVVPSTRRTHVHYNCIHGWSKNKTITIKNNNNNVAKMKQLKISSHLKAARFVGKWLSGCLSLSFKWCIWAADLVCLPVSVVLDTNQWFHSTVIMGNNISIAIGSEYDWQRVTRGVGTEI